MSKNLEESIRNTAETRITNIEPLESVNDKLLPSRGTSVIKSSYLLERRILIDIHEDYWSMIIPLHNISTSADKWWRFSYAIEKILNDYPNNIQCIDYGFTCNDFNTEIFTKWLEYFYFPTGKNYESFKHSLQLMHFFKWSLIPKNYAVIPVLTNPELWGVELFTPIGTVHFGDEESPYVPSMYQREDVKLISFPNGLKYINEDVFSIISQDNKMWNEGNKIYSLCTKESGSLSFPSILRTFKTLITWKRYTKDNPIWKTAPTPWEYEIHDKTMEKGYVEVPNIPHQEFHLDYSLEYNIGKGVAGR